MKWNSTQWFFTFVLAISGIYVFSNYLKILVYGVHPTLMPMVIVAICTTIIAYILLIFGWLIDGRIARVKRVD